MAADYLPSRISDSYDPATRISPHGTITMTAPVLTRQRPVSETVDRRSRADSVAKQVGDRASTRLSVGFVAMTAFVAAGFVRLCVGMPVAVYLLVVTTALTVFTASLLVDDTRAARTPSRRLRRDLSATRISRTSSAKVSTEVMQ